MNTRPLICGVRFAGALPVALLAGPAVRFSVHRRRPPVILVRCLPCDRDYADFVLRPEYQLSPGANSGVALRMPPKAPKQLEVQIADDSAVPPMSAPFEFTGSLYGVKLEHLAQPNPPGEWNRMEIELKGRSLRVMVNDQETTQVSLDEPAVAKFLGGPAPAGGRIGLQGWHGSARFRNIELQELGPAP
ncbi:MAG TPA: DUF1080 domain-containing protein [Gemmataceae bacterium]|nr:DUF1080 domain-containing protein [Gemmataceae bacterium]